MRFKIVFSLVLILSIALSLIGCTYNDSTDQPSYTNPTYTNPTYNTLPPDLDVFDIEPPDIDWDSFNFTDPTEQTDNNQGSPGTSNQPGDNYNEMVWIPRTGSKYHTNPNCSGMIAPAYVTIGEARNRGFTPCSKCY